MIKSKNSASRNSKSIPIGSDPFPEENEVKVENEKIHEVTCEIEDSNIFTSLDVISPKEPPGFEIIKRIDTGGMAYVFQAREISLNRIVALKMLRSSVKTEEKNITRFHQEAELVALLQHPNIVQIYGCKDYAGLPYLCLEWVDGGNLDELLSVRKLEIREAVRLMIQIASAIQVAHDHKVIHRDLKPSNILLTKEGNPKIADFGIAKLTSIQNELSTKAGLVLGTPTYMSPEQARGERNLGPETDIFSMGIILYEMLTGAPPFQGANAMATIDSIIKDHPVPPVKVNKNISFVLNAICLKCLHKKPNFRYKRAEDLAIDLQRFLDNKPVSVAGRFCCQITRYILRVHYKKLIFWGAQLIFFLVAMLTIYKYQKFDDQNQNIIESRAKLSQEKLTTWAKKYHSERQTVGGGLWDLKDFIDESKKSLDGIEVCSDAASKQKKELIDQLSSDQSLIQQFEQLNLLEDRLHEFWKRPWTKEAKENLLLFSRNLKTELEVLSLDSWVISDHSNLTFEGRKLEGTLKIEFAHSVALFAIVEKVLQRDITKLIELANRLDENPWRVEIRNAILLNKFASLHDFLSTDTIFYDVDAGYTCNLLVQANLILADRSDLNQIIQFLRKANDAIPGDNSIISSLIYALSMTKDRLHWSEALGMLQVSEHTSPNDEKMGLIHGELLEKAKRGEEAIMLYNRLLQTKRSDDKIIRQRLERLNAAKGSN